MKIRELCAVGIALAGPLVLWLPRLSGPIDLRYDAGVYYILGTSLAEGNGYRLLNEPGDIEAVQYPPLLSAMVAVHQWALGTNRPEVVGRWLRLTYFVLSMLYALAVYLLARQYLGAFYATVVTTITNLYLHTIFLSDLLFADIPFALVTVLFIICNRRSEKLAGFASASILGCMAYLLRTAGIALFAAWVAESLFQKRWWQVAARAAIALVPVAGWQAYISHVVHSGEYKSPAYAYQRAPYQYYNVPYGDNLALVDSFAPELGHISAAGTAKRVATNLVTLSVSLGEAVTAGQGFWVWLLRSVEKAAGKVIRVRLPYWVVIFPICMFSSLVFAGAVVFLLRRDWFIPAYAGATVGLICLTPWPAQFTRYLTPITPLLALCLIRALLAFRDYFQRRWAFSRQVAGWTLIALAISTPVLVEAYTIFRTRNLYYDYEPVKLTEEKGSGSRLLFYSEAWVAYHEALEWIRGHAAPGVVVATSAPHWAYLLTGVKAVLPPMEIDPVYSQQLLDSVSARYVILDALQFTGGDKRSIARYAAAAIEAHPGSWEEVFASGDGATRVYKRVGREGH